MNVSANKKSVKKKKVIRKSISSQPQWTDLIGGVLAIGAGLFCIIFFLGVLNVPQESEITFEPVVRGVEIEAAEEVPVLVQPAEQTIVSIPLAPPPEPVEELPVEQGTIEF